MGVVGVWGEGGGIGERVVNPVVLCRTDSGPEVAGLVYEADGGVAGEEVGNGEAVVCEGVA